MPRVGIDYESDPSGFVAASRQVTAAAAEPLAQFDLTDRTLKRLAVQYLSTGDAAKQASLIQHMSAVQVANDIAASSAKQVASQHEIQAATRETSAVQAETAQKSGGLGRLIDAAFKGDTLRNWRGELKETAHAAGESGGNVGKLAGAVGLLGGSMLITAAAAPLINRAFGALQKPAELLDHALFGADEKMQEFKKSTQDTASALTQAFGVATAGPIKNIGDLDSKSKLLAATMDDLVEANHRAAGTPWVGDGWGVQTQNTKEYNAALKVATEETEHNRIQQEQFERHLKSLAVQMGDTGAQADGYARELAVVGGDTSLLVNAGPATIAALAGIGNQMAATSAQAADLANTAAAAQASIAALIAADVNLPGVLKQARTQGVANAIGASVGAALNQAGSISNLRAQGVAYNLADNPVKAASGGGGSAGKAAANDARQQAEAAVALKNAKLEAASKMTDASVAAAVKVREARNALAIDKKGTLDYYKDLASFHQAVAAQTALAKQAAADQKRNTLELRNAQLEATSNMQDQATADAVHIKEAQAALALDKKGSLDYWRDLKTLNDAKAAAAADAADAAKQAADAAKQAQQDQIALQNAIVQAGIDYSDPLSSLRAAVTEAQNTLSGDTAGTTQFYLDTAALHQAQQQLADALSQNTEATTTNTAAMTGVQAGGQLPSYLADRVLANAGAFVGGASGAGGRAVLPPVYVTVLLDGKEVGATVEPAVTSAQAARARRNS